MGGKRAFKSFFSDAEVTKDAYQKQLAELAEGRKFKKLWQFDPSLPLENGWRTYSKDAIRMAFGDAPPQLSDMARAIGVPLDTLKGWNAPKDSKKHRAIHIEQFAMIVAAGVAHSQPSDTPEARTKVACRMLYARTPREREQDARDRKSDARNVRVKAIALRAAALDEESLELMLQLSERLLSTSAPSGGFDWWSNESVGYLFAARGEKRPDIEDDEHEQIDRAEYYALVKDAVSNADTGLIDDLWDAQPVESPLNPYL